MLPAPNTNFSNNNKALNQEFTAAEIMRSSFWGSIPSANLDVYVIKNSKNFYNNNLEICNKVLNQCADVQDSIWNKTYSILENTFDTGTLVLYVSENKVKGFLSASHYKGSSDVNFIYYSDLMLAESIHGKGLCTLGIGVLNSSIINETDITSQTQKFICVMASGNFAAFGAFLKDEFFSAISIPNLERANYELLIAMLQTSFPLLSTTPADEVIRGGWGQQNKLDKIFWPADFVSKAKFPENVDYRQGDALLKLYLCSKNDSDRFDLYLARRFLCR